MAVFLLAALIVFGELFPYDGKEGDSKKGGTDFFAGSLAADLAIGGRGSANALSGLALQAAAFAREPLATALGSSLPPNANDSSDYNLSGQATILSAVIDAGEAAGPSRDGLIKYRVQNGDTLYGIASYFGISLDTIVNANPGVKAKSLRVGDELSILPTSGAIYTARDGDTLESVANYFGVPEEKISQFNKSVNFGALEAGMNLIIPGVKNISFSYKGLNSLPNLSADFTEPTEGYDWGALHHYNAVDIANSCGTPVVAAAEGLVVPDDNFGKGDGGWNGGYGIFVLIEHPMGDGIRTRYAHLSRALVGIGDYVKQGQEIGLMGDTGDATGCHLHFEVYGAQNPLAR